MRASRATVMLALGASLGMPESTQIPVTELSPTQHAAIDGGEGVLLTHDRPESPWPAVTFYFFIDATPEEAVSVFVDYEQQSSYIPRLKRSHISQRLDPSTTEVDYIVELPVVRDEAYTVRDHLVAEGGGHFRVEWTLVRATSTKATIGHARFSPYANARSGRTGTLLEYHNAVTPGSRVAGLGFIRTRAIHQVAETARAIGAKVEAERRREALDDRITALRAALACTGGTMRINDKC